MHTQNTLFLRWMLISIAALAVVAARAERVMVGGSSEPAGEIIISAGNNPSIVGLEVLGTGEIVFAVTNERGTFLLRQRVDGSADKSFGIDGQSEVRPPRPDFELKSLTTDPHGRILFGGNSPRGGGAILISRRLANGKLDPRFGDNGWLTVSRLDSTLAMQQLEVLANGKPLILGTQTIKGKPTAVVVRLNLLGQPDPSFGTGGIKLLSGFEGQDFEVNAMSPQADGGMLVGGRLGSQAMVMQLTQNGELDREFGTQGMVKLSPRNRLELAGFAHLPEGNDTVKSLVATAGKIYAGGVVRQSSNDCPFLTQLSAGGKVNRGFGRDGTITESVCRGQIDSLSVLMQNDRSVVQAHTVRDPQGAGELRMMRYGREGIADATFAAGGVFSRGLGKIAHPTVDAFIQRDGMIIVSTVVKDGARSTIKLFRER